MVSFQDRGAVCARSRWLGGWVFAAALLVCLSACYGGTDDGKSPDVQLGAAGATYRIYGVIRCGLLGFGISGIRMYGLPGDPETDSDGNYEATVPAGWSGAVYPQESWLHFDPPFRVYNNVAANEHDDYETALPEPVLSGYVRTASGQGVPGVLLNGLPDDPVTNSHGYYAAYLGSGFSGTVTPQKAGYTFSPPSLSYDDVDSDLDGEDYTAVDDNLVTLSGFVRTASGAGLSGVALAGLPTATKTDASGYYIALVAKGWSGTVTPQRSGYTFAPPNRAYDKVAVKQSEQNFAATPLPIIVTLTTCPTQVKRGATVAITWTVANGKPTQHNHAQWWTSLDAKPSPRPTPQDLSVPYQARFVAPTRACTVYIQVHAIVNSASYYSKTARVTVK